LPYRFFLDKNVIQIYLGVNDYFWITSIIFMTKKAGRPKVAKSKARAPGISVRLTQAERKPIDAAIKVSGLTQSNWARKSLLYVATSGICIT
jgi:hypothetical protein